MTSLSSIKKISIEQLQPGMFVHDLDCGWLQHPFLFNRFLVVDDSMIERIARAGIKAMYIDVERGDDIAAPTRVDVVRGIEQRVQSLAQMKAEAAKRSITVDEERRRAAKLYQNASQKVREVLFSARMGAAADLEKLDPVVESIVDSIFRHSDALIPLSRLKRHDSYTYEHAVASAAMMAAFGRHLNLDRSQIRDIALGAMLQDIGMARVPSAIVEKPGRLNPNEVAVVRGHVEHSHDIAQELASLPMASMEVIAQHHERIDGTGYPFRLRGDQITLHAQMAAIVDVYDAMTSQRPYQTPTSPTQALRKLYEWGQHHFSADLVQAFIRTVGIYPVGSLVRMESGMIGVVMEQTDDLLKPVVKIFYNTKTRNYLTPVLIRVGRFAGANHGGIAGHESFEKWNIDPGRWVPT